MGKARIYAVSTMSSTLTYSFPNREQRNRFLSLIAANVGEYGYGLGLTFEGLEYRLDHADGRGDLISDAGKRAKGSWTLRGNTVELDVAFIAASRDSWEKTREKIWEVASQFGAG